MIVKLKNVRLAFPSIFAAKAMKPGDEPRFSATFIFAPDHPAHQEIKDAILQAAKDKWAGKWEETLKAIKAKGDICLRDGAEKADFDGFDGKMFVSASTKTQPAVVDRDRTSLTLADGRPYGGCQVNAIIDIWAQDNGFGKRINASLSGVQFFADGDSFGGARPARAEDFDAVEETSDIF